MTRGGLVTNGLAVPVTGWGQLIIGSVFLHMYMAQEFILSPLHTACLPLEGRNPTFWEGFSFANKETEAQVR